jgi:hypothetical protein
MQLSRKTGWLAPALFLAAVAAVPAGAAEPDKYVPSDSDAVVVVNVRQILESPFFKKYALEEAKNQLKTNKDATKFFQTAGIDPFKDVHSVVLAGSSFTKSEPKFVIVVHGNFDPDKIHTAITEAAKKEGEDLKVETKDGLRVYEFKNNKAKDSKPVFGAFANKSTLILTPSSDQTVAAAKGTGGKLGSDLASALEKLGKESVYAAIAVTKEMNDALAGSPQMAPFKDKIQYITGIFDVTSDFKTVLTIQTKDDQTANKVKGFIGQMVPLLGLMAQGQAEQLGQAVNDLVKKIEIKKDAKNAVSVSLTVTEDMMKQMHEAGSAAEKEKNEKGKQ